MVSTRRAVSPGHVLGLAAVLLAPRGGAPQPGAGGHVGAGRGPGPKHQLTLRTGVKILSSKLVLLLSLQIQVVISRQIP